MKRESFLLFTSFYEPIKHLSDKELGQLFRTIFEYQKNPENPVGSVGSNVLMAFEFFKNQFRLDDIKYQKIVERNRKNSLKGGRPKKPSGSQSVPVGTKKPDNGNDNDNSYAKPGVSSNDLDKKKAWDTFSSLPLKGISDPIWIQEVRAEFLAKAKVATEKSVRGFIASKLARQKPDPNLTTDVWNVPSMPVDGGLQGLAKAIGRQKNEQS